MDAALGFGLLLLVALIGYAVTTHLSKKSQVENKQKLYLSHTNEVNKKLYEDAFISNGEYGDLNSWKPDIDERLIEEHCEIDGKYVPATPLGYRDYLESRKEGIKAILAGEHTHMLTKEEAHDPEIKDALSKYDNIAIDKKPYVVTAVEDDRYYVVDEELHQYYLEYQKQ